jgi:hypothetical protein
MAPGSFGVGGRRRKHDELDVAIPIRKSLRCLFGPGGDAMVHQKFWIEK